MPKNLRIPDESAWYGYEEDLDVRDMHDMFFGKSIDEVQRYFGPGSISRADELLFAPRPVFQYYVHAFGKFLLSSQAVGDSDSASPFLRLLDSREDRDPGSVRSIYPSLVPYVDFVANNQVYFEADIDIYGDFRELANRIREKCGV
ncbi:MAG: hypothetical protein HY253_10205 [Burkholderiales bacterium]|nr:hypothetical protein [Burkholderiales bacterium]